MRQLFPLAAAEVDPAEVYADLPSAEGRPSLRLNMISSVDGATTLDGVSGGLGSLGDKRVFAVLRSLADVVLVAAGTVRAEHYGPSTAPIAVVTRSAGLDWQSGFFSEAKARPMVLTVDDAPKEERLKPVEGSSNLFQKVDRRQAIRVVNAPSLTHVAGPSAPSLICGRESAGPCAQPLVADSSSPAITSALARSVAQQRTAPSPSRTSWPTSPVGSTSKGGLSARPSPAG